MCIKCIERANPGKTVEYINVEDKNWRLPNFGSNFQTAGPALMAQVHELYGPEYLVDMVDFTVYGVYRVV